MLVDPTGALLTRPSGKRVVKFTNPKLAVIAANADDAFRLLQLTVVCIHCGATPECRNHASDVLWKMTCGCTERVLVNPSVRS